MKKEKTQAQMGRHLEGRPEEEHPPMGGLCRREWSRKDLAMEEEEAFGWHGPHPARQEDSRVAVPVDAVTGWMTH